jgi:predicted nucleic acid-binding protein
MTGLDSGFFIELLRGGQQAVRVWREILEGRESVVSCISIFELKRLALKGMIEAGAVDTVIEAIMNICHISWIEHKETLDSAASLSHGLGIHMADALILSGFVACRVTVIYTTDPHFSLYRKKGIKVILIPPLSGAPG